MLGSGIKAKIAEHESGCQKTFFSSFECSPVTDNHFDQIFKRTKEELGHTSIIQVLLGASQTLERKILEKMGFAVDGVRYGIAVDRLRSLIQQKKSGLLSGYQIRAFDFDQDIEKIVDIEKSIHAADKTSRVNFETEASVESMKNYYRRASSSGGVLLLLHTSAIIGVAGFMKDPKQETAAHVSSIGLALPFQGKGLFLPFLLAAFDMSPFKDLKILTGVTTTSRLILASETYGAEIFGYLLSRRE